MRALVVATVVMGVMIVLGTAGLIAVIVHRLGGAPPARPLVLDEPAGTHIAGVTATADRLAVQLQGGGPDRLLLIDPRTGQTIGRLSLPQ